MIEKQRGVLALDGEREVEFGPESRLSVSLHLDGPRTVDIGRVMRLAVEQGLFTERASVRMNVRMKKSAS